MTMRADELRHWETQCPDAVVLLVRDYVRMRESIVTIPTVNIAAAEAAGRRFRWNHGEVIELHANGEVCVVNPFAVGPLT